MSVLSGKGETSSMVLAIIVMMVLVVAFSIVTITGLMEDIGTLATSGSPEVLSRDIAGFAMIIHASPGDAAIYHLLDSKEEYNVTMEAREVKVEVISETIIEGKEAEATIGIGDFHFSEEPIDRISITKSSGSIIVKGANEAGVLV